YVVGSAGLVCCLDSRNGAQLWTFDIASHSQTRPRIFSSPSAVRAEEVDAQHHLLYLGAELSNPASSAAVLYCLRD
ncbi:MAG TPA: hypothetical protein VKI17_02250, partial [Gemmataceae bacterium]|nr:hypothetical protein [Gemmataceae bacterium]